jgi:hypothetical protein
VTNGEGGRTCDAVNTRCDLLKRAATIRQHVRHFVDDPIAEQTGRTRFQFIPNQQHLEAAIVSQALTNWSHQRGRHFGVLSLWYRLAGP